MENWIEVIEKVYSSVLSNWDMVKTNEMEIIKVALRIYLEYLKTYNTYLTNTTSNGTSIFDMQISSKLYFYKTLTKNDEV